jgi:hypothetical protein
MQSEALQKAFSYSKLYKSNSYQSEREGATPMGTRRYHIQDTMKFDIFTNNKQFILMFKMLKILGLRFKIQKNRLAILTNETYNNHNSRVIW